MKKLFLVPLAVALITSITFELNAQSLRTNPKVVAFGDSLTSGTSTDTTWHDFLERWSGVEIINEGVSGDTVGDALDRVEDVTEHNPDITFVFLGGNDILQGIDEEVTFSNLALVVERIQESGSEVILMGIQRDNFDSDREEGYANVAAQTGATYVPNVFSGILGRPQYFNDITDDPVHPNANGHELIAERVWPQYQSALDDLPQNFPLTVTCRIDYADERDPENEAIAGEQVTFRGYAWGGNGTYTYTWLGEDDNVIETGRVYSPTLDNDGEVEFSLNVESGSEDVTTTCPEVTVRARQLAASCAVDVNSEDMTVTYRAAASRGSENDDIEFLWEGEEDNGDEWEEENNITTVTYDEAGFKEATLTVTSGEQELSFTCGGELNEGGEEDEDGDLLTPLSGSCDARDFSYGENTIFYEASASGDSDPYDFNWEIDGESYENESPEVTFDNPGRKEAELTITSENSSIDLLCQSVLVDNGDFDDDDNNDDGGDNKDSGCFIATAAYGTEMEPEVEALRQWRDESLLTQSPGRMFVKTYYSLSPPFADAIRESDTLRSVTRTLLSPLVSTVEALQK